MQVYNSNGNSYLAYNKNLFIGTDETIVLEAISHAGFSKLSLVIVNHGTDSTGGFNIYGSDDGINYFAFVTGIVDGVSAGDTSSYQLSNLNNSTAVAPYIRITGNATSTTCNVDVYLLGAL